MSGKAMAGGRDTPCERRTTRPRTVWGEARRDLRDDLRRLRPGRRLTPWRVLETAASEPGFLSCLILRGQIALHRLGRERAAFLLRVVNNALTGADVLPGAVIGGGLLLPHPSGVVIGRGVRVGSGVTILQHVTLGERRADGQGDHAYPHVADDVLIGAGSIVLGEVTLGSGSRVAAGSLVLHSVGAGMTAVGSPAVVRP